MWSDWIRALRDKELLYKKLLCLADQVEDAAKGAYEAMCRRVNQTFNFVLRAFRIACVITAVVTVLWLGSRLFKVESAGFYQVLVLVAGAAWAWFLIWIAVFLGALDGIIKQFPG